MLVVGLCVSILVGAAWLQVASMPLLPWLPIVVFGLSTLLAVCIQPREEKVIKLKGDLASVEGKIRTHHNALEHEAELSVKLSEIRPALVEARSNLALIQEETDRNRRIVSSL